MWHYFVPKIIQVLSSQKFLETVFVNNISNICIFIINPSLINNPFFYVADEIFFRAKNYLKMSNL